MLDLGCGPGFLAVAFAEYASDIIGIDPELTMLEEARHYARAHEATVRFQLGSSYDLDDDLAPLKLVTMGRSFHWMDRKATLNRLDHLVGPDGAIALFGDQHLDLAANRWKKRFEDVLEPYAKTDPAHKLHRSENPDWVPHEEVLLASPFCQLRRVSVVQKLETPVDCLLDRALSRSTTSPQRLGDAQEDLLAALRALFAEEAPDGFLREVVEAEALLAFRE